MYFYVQGYFLHQRILKWYFIIIGRINRYTTRFVIKYDYIEIFLLILK